MLQTIEPPKTKTAVKTVLLIQPRTGSYDKIVRDIPLGLLSCATLVRKAGYRVKVLDARIDTDSKEKLPGIVNEHTVLVGLSVMTGKPIHYALEISRFIKQYWNVPIMWGGPHPTLAPDNVLDEPSIDFLCRGDGEEPTCELAKALDEHPNRNEIPFEKIIGISYKKDGKVFHNPVSKRTSILDWREIPYDLVDGYSYHRFDSKEVLFPIVTSIGCPYRCTFCYLSADEMRQKWLAYEPEDLIEYVAFLREKFAAKYISVIDHDFFVNLKRARRFFELLVEKGWDVQFGFRGTRVDELDQMDEEMLRLMEKARVKHLHIGAESGSQRMLDFYDKKTTVEQIIRVNRKLRHFPKLLPSYNFFGGTPTETMDDLRKSVQLIYTLVTDNPHCQISSFNQYVPFPGGKLTDVAIQHGFKPPKTLQEWANYDDSEAAQGKLPWVTEETKKLLLNMNFCGVFIDRKIPDHFTRMTPKHLFYRLAWCILNPIARLRVKHQFFAFPIEYYALRQYHHMLDS